MNSLPRPVKDLISDALRDFDAAGLVDLEPGLAHPLYQASVERYRSWIAAGEHASMQYLERGMDRRTDPRKVFPQAKSVLVVLKKYSSRAWGDGKVGPKIARYARGPDYHETLKQGLEVVCTRIAESQKGLTYKVCVDTSAVLERSWGVLAGLGWIGKNGLLIHPKLGSFFLMGVALLSESFGAPPAVINDRCGSCERCLKACPTQAITSRAWVQSQKCISYQTLEHRGADPLWPATEWVAGCDVCQEVCPFNIKALKDVGEPEVTRWEDFVDPVLLAETSKSSALSRVGEAGWRRNIARLMAQEKKSE